MPEPMGSDAGGQLALYGHPFSSYTWKAQIALYANATPFDFRIVDDDHPDHQAVVRQAGPLAKFPVLADGTSLIFEATSIIEQVASRHPGEAMLIPPDPDAAAMVRMLDRVFDNYVMAPMQQTVAEYLRNRDAPDRNRIAECAGQLDRTYRWLDGWLRYYPPLDGITLVECAAAPSLFYADWINPIGDDCPRLKRWRAHLLALPQVARCIDDARPWREFFPPGAPDRD